MLSECKKSGFYELNPASLFFCHFLPLMVQNRVLLGAKMESFLEAKMESFLGAKMESFLEAKMESFLGVKMESFFLKIQTEKKTK
jgi:uncharacterized protein YbcI